MENQHLKVFLVSVKNLNQKEGSINDKMDFEK